MFIGMEDIAGVRKGSEIICFDCVDDATLNDIESEEEIITRAEVDSTNTGLFFCDTCRNAL
jgi:hypothetical protein